MLVPLICAWPSVNIGGGVAAVGGGGSSSETPNGTVSVSNSDCTTGNAHTTLDDDPDSPGGDWCEATDDGTDHVIMLNMTDPAFTPSTGAGAQEIAVYVKKVVDATQSDPTLTINVYDGTNCADLHETGASPSAISSGTGQLVTQTWTALGISGGADICVQLSCARSGGSPANRRSCSYDAVEWRAVE